MFPFRTSLYSPFLIVPRMPGRNRYYKRKLFFVTQDRILLHLLEYVGREGEFNQPDEITQFGIADAIGLGRSTVSKAIQRLEDAGLVGAQRAHVPSGALRRTVYLLTEAGVQKANRRKAEIEEQVVLLREPAGMERRLKVAQIPNLLPEYAPLLDVATHVSEGVFDLGSFRGRGKRLVDFTERVPRPRYFFGRGPELAEMDAWLRDPEGKVLVITGLTGIGKSTLLARRLEGWREERHVFFHRIMPWTTLRNVAVQLSEFLTRLSRRALAQYLEATQAVDIEQVVKILVAGLEGVPAVLMYDDYHTAEPPVRDFFYAFRAALETMDGPKLVVAGRHVPPFYDRRDVRVKGLVREMSLTGLDPASATKILEARNLTLPTDATEAILRQTGGHPLFLELVDFGTGSLAGDINRYLKEELFSKITEEDAKVLTLASIFREPVPADALYQEEDVDPARLAGLVEQSLLLEVSPKVYDVHDLVRAFFVEMATPKDRRRFHRMAAQFYLAATAPNPLEALHHLVQAEDYLSAARVAVKEGRDILKHDTEHLLALVDRLIPQVEDPAQGLELRLLRAHALDIRGEIDRAMAGYQEVLQIASAPGFERKAAEAHAQLGDLHRRRGERGGAEEQLEAGLRLYRTAEDARGQAEVLFGLGALAEDRADFARAEKLYERSGALARQLGIRELDAELEVAAARLLELRGEHADSLERKHRAFTLAESLGDWHLLAKLHISLGTTYYSLKRYDDALQVYDQGVSLARRIGNLRMVAFGCFNAAGVHLRSGNDLKGESLLREAGELFRTIRDPKMEARVLEYEGTMWSKRGKWGLGKQRFMESIARLREAASPTDLVATLYAFSFYCHQNGETDAALRALDEAELLARRLKLDALLVEMQDYRRSFLAAPPDSVQRPGADAAPTA